MLDKNNIYFLGAGGIGMSALVRYFLAQGKKVAGYDKTPTDLTDQLILEGAELHFEDDPEMIDERFKDPSNCLVIFTPAIPKDSIEKKFFEEARFTILKRAQVLGLITQSQKSIAIAGTHGKTTVSSMVAHCLKHSKTPSTAFLGGLSKDLQSNYHHENGSEVTVIEADEYDRSFLQLTPSIIGVTAIDPDHLDIYGDEAEMDRTFREFLNEKLLPGGKAIIESKLKAKLGSDFLTYSLSDQNADYRAENFKVVNAEFSADFIYPGGKVEGLKLQFPGIHNMENALLCFATLHQYGLEATAIKSALQAYQGVIRRFDVHIKEEQLVYIDDYAHHPQEISQLVLSVKEMYPDKKICGAFQPHLFSRTQDFLEGFAQSLELLDEIVLLDIYPARELPIPGVNSELLLSKIRKNSKTLCSKKDLGARLSESDCEVVLTIGAGDIGMEVEKVKQSLMNRLNEKLK